MSLNSTKVCSLARIQCIPLFNDKTPFSVMKSKELDMQIQKFVKRSFKVVSCITFACRQYTSKYLCREQLDVLTRLTYKPIHPPPPPFTFLIELYSRIIPQLIKLIYIAFMIPSCVTYYSHVWIIDLSFNVYDLSKIREPIYVLGQNTVSSNHAPNHGYHTPTSMKRETDNSLFFLIGTSKYKICLNV